MTGHVRSDRARRARDLFLTNSNNCAQGIIRAYVSMSEEAEDAIIPLSWVLGGGLASSGNVCGTLMGAVMVLGAKLRHEYNLSSADAESLIKGFIQEFQSKYGSLQCRDIVGELEPERFESICRPMVYDTCLLMEEFLAMFDEESEGDE